MRPDKDLNGAEAVVIDEMVEAVEEVRREIEEIVTITKATRIEKLESGHLVSVTLVVINTPLKL